MPPQINSDLSGGSAASHSVPGAAVFVTPPTMLGIVLAAVKFRFGEQFGMHYRHNHVIASQCAHWRGNPFFYSEKCCNHNVFRRCGLPRRLRLLEMTRRIEKRSVDFKLPNKSEFEGIIFTETAKEKGLGIWRNVRESFLSGTAFCRKCYFLFWG